MKSKYFELIEKRIKFSVDLLRGVMSLKFIFYLRELSV